MNEANINKALSSVQKSMEFEGFVVDSALLHKGRAILENKTTSTELVDEYIRTIKVQRNERQL